MIRSLISFRYVARCGERNYGRIDTYEIVYTRYFSSFSISRLNRVPVATRANAFTSASSLQFANKRDELRRTNVGRRRWGTRGRRRACVAVVSIKRQAHVIKTSQARFSPGQHPALEFTSTRTSQQVPRETRAVPLLRRIREIPAASLRPSLSTPSHP